MCETLYPVFLCKTLSPSQIMCEWLRLKAAIIFRKILPKLSCCDQVLRVAVLCILLNHCEVVMYIRFLDITIALGR